MTFSNTLMQLGSEDFLRELTEFMLNRIMEADVTQRINAEPHERSNEREAYRNGYRERRTTPAFGRLTCASLSDGKAPAFCPSSKSAGCRRKC
ncbi:TPA: transposase [Klebsiella pneumoniae]|uniref:transposase n=1 Tax=Klebsiella TaxID=570 RepID=UPI0022351D4E|nr:transposase [Klebsiella pneumoniae]MDN2601870.1 transposase [Klebsiella pneumoniae]